MRVYPFAIQRYPHYIMTCNPVLYDWIFLYLDFTQWMTGTYSVNPPKQRTNREQIENANFSVFQCVLHRFTRNSLFIHLPHWSATMRLLPKQPVWPKAVRNWTNRSNEQSMNAWRTSLIISTNSRKSASNTLFRMNTNPAGQLLRFPVSWRMILFVKLRGQWNAEAPLPGHKDRAEQ